MTPPDIAVWREIRNPITRTDVKIDPPYEPQDADEELRFIMAFNQYCQWGWDFERADPQQIRVPLWNLRQPEHPELVGIDA